VSRVAKTDEEAIVRAFGMMRRQGRDRDVTNRGFHHLRYKPSKLGLTLSESLIP